MEAQVDQLHRKNPEMSVVVSVDKTTHFQRVIDALGIPIDVDPSRQREIPDLVKRAEAAALTLRTRAGRLAVKAEGDAN